MSYKIPSKEYIDTRIDSFNNGPKDVFDTVAELTSTNPDHGYIYLVLENGYWYFWDGEEWLQGGHYGTTPEIVQLKTDAQTAKTQAESARDLAVSAKDNAVIAKDNAVIARGLAEDARDEAQAIAGGVAGTYDTLVDLQTDDPSHGSVYLVVADANWYYWDIGASDWVAGGVYSNEPAITSLNARLDTLEGTGEGSVAKAIDDALEPIEERIESLERGVKPVGVLFEGMPAIVTGERTLGASSSTLRVNAGAMDTTPYPETDIKFQFPFNNIRNAKINANFEVQAWVDEPDFLTATGILATRLPAIYVNDDLYDIRISKTPRVGYHLHPLHVDAVTGLKREYVWIGSDKSSKVDGENKLTCELLKPYYTSQRADTVLRPYSQAVGTGWSQGDIALRDYLRILLLVAGNSHNLQSVFGRGVCDLRYSTSDVVTVETVATNYVVVSDATGALYNVGEAVNLGTALGNTAKFAQRNITLKEVNYDGLGNTRITVDGATFTSSATNVLWHAPQLVSEANFVAMGNECGYIGTNGRSPVSFFGIWNLWGNIWEWCDGIFHVDLVPYYTYDPSKYSLIGASQPADLSQFTQHPTTMPASSGYCGQFAGTPAVPSTLTGGSDSAGMCDYFYTSTGYKALLVGGYLNDGSNVGFFDWLVYYTPSDAVWIFGSRLLGRP